MNHLYVRFKNTLNQSESNVFGPFDYVEVTYGQLRTGEDGQIILAEYIGGRWFTCDNNREWTDFLVVSERSRV